jgi:hypothetical protein
MTNPRTTLNNLTARHRGAVQTAVASFSVLAICLMLAATAQAEFGFSNSVTELIGPGGFMSVSNSTQPPSGESITPTDLSVTPSSRRHWVLSGTRRMLPPVPCNS